MSAAPATQEQQTPLVVAEPTLTLSEKFIAKVQKQFTATMGDSIAWTQLQKTLGQHLYVKIDSSFRALEIKRAGSEYKKNDPEISWANVNWDKLTQDTVNVVSMELDAFQANHVHVIPYLNGRTGKYDVDLRVGYMGLDYITRKFALDPVLDIEYQLVHATDKFSYGTKDGVAYRNFEQENPFNPGDVVGGYVYVTYDDPRKNKVIIVEYREFEKAMKASGGTQFWGGEQEVWEGPRGQRTKRVEYDEKFRKEMMFKTVVIRGCKKIRLDPAKINCVVASMLDAIDVEVTSEADTYANQELLSLAEESESVVKVPEGHVAVPKSEYEAAMAELQPTQPNLSGVGDAEESAPY